MQYLSFEICIEGVCNLGFYYVNKTQETKTTNFIMSRESSTEKLFLCGLFTEETKQHLKLIILKYKKKKKWLHLFKKIKSLELATKSNGEC